MTKSAKIIDRCDNFYEIVDADTGGTIPGIAWNGRFAFRRAAEEAARKAGYSIVTTP